MPGKKQHFAMFQGMLEKKGSWWQGWKSRLMVLRDNVTLSYFKTVGDDMMTYQGSILINSDMTVSRGPPNPERFIIQIATVKKIVKRHHLYTLPGRVYLLAAPSSAVQDAWIAALNRAIAAAPPAERCTTKDKGKKRRYAPVPTDFFTIAPIGFKPKPKGLKNIKVTSKTEVSSDLVFSHVSGESSPGGSNKSKKAAEKTKGNEENTRGNEENTNNQVPSKEIGSKASKKDESK